MHAEYMCRSQRITRGHWFSLSAIWILGMKFRLLDLMKTAFYRLRCVQSLGKERYTSTLWLTSLLELGHMKKMLRKESYSKSMGPLDSSFLYVIGMDTPVAEFPHLFFKLWNESWWSCDSFRNVLYPTHDNTTLDSRRDGCHSEGIKDVWVVALIILFVFYRIQMDFNGYQWTTPNSAILHLPC